MRRALVLEICAGDQNDGWVVYARWGGVEFQDKAVRHSYGPRGHRGISVLIFEATMAEIHGELASRCREDNQQLVYLKKQASKSQNKAKALERYSYSGSEKHHEAVEENNILRKNSEDGREPPEMIKQSFANASISVRTRRARLSFLQVLDFVSGLDPDSSKHAYH
ncbi:hypothetical protein HAX54_018624, partial [Datura stramonium]|nr:hypothetical protein [Datura stramonium]